MGATKTDQYSGEIKQTAAINTALAHPARLMIIKALKEQPGIRPVDLMDITGLRHTATSEHLRKLRSVGLVEYQYVCHNYQVFLNLERFEKAVRFLNEITE